jgi:hypothetical protein
MIDGPNVKLFHYAVGQCSDNSKVKVSGKVCQRREVLKDMAAKECDSKSTSEEEVYLKGVQYFNPCKVANEYINDVIECRQPLEEVRKIKETCAKEGGRVVVKVDAHNCSVYACSFLKEDKEIDCLKKEDIPKEKITDCESRGGTFVYRAADNGCGVFARCVLKETATRDKAEVSVNKEILNDKSQLLSMALKIETLKMEFSKISKKLTSIGNFYQEQGNEDYQNFFDASVLADSAVAKLDSVKNMIKENVDNFNEDKAKEVRIALHEVKENILKEILLAILG